MERFFQCFPLALPSADDGIWLGGNPLNFSLPLLSLQLFLVFTVTRLICFILKPLRQPRVVSEIIGGIILGPSLLSRNEAFKRTVFPEWGTPVLETVATFGLMYVTFLIGVKMDPGLVKRSGKKAAIIGLSGMLVPFVLMTISLRVSKIARDTDDYNNFVFSVTAVVSATSFSVLVPMLSDFRLLNSEIGRTAMSASMTNDGVGWIIVAVFIVAESRKVSVVTPLWAFLAIFFLLVVIVCFIRPVAMWVIANTPPGKPVDEGYVFFFLFIVLVVGFFSDIVGMSFFQGALVLGLAIPDGPPLGAALVEKIECIVSGILLPLYCALTGLNTDLSAITDMHAWKTLQVAIVLGWLGKFAGVLAPSLYFSIPFHDAVSLSLFMNSKGIFEVITFHFWKANKIVDEQAYATLVLSTITVTAITTPLATLLYDPLRRYTTYKRRTVQHHKHDEELRILACVQDQAHVPPTINLLEAVSTSFESPITVYVLHLLELKGRDAPLLIHHNNKLARSASLAHHASQSSHIINAFLVHERRHPSLVSVQPFTTISPYASMHDEVCHLALEKRANLILLPFHKKPAIGGGVEANARLRAMNQRVFAHAPCSIGILVDHGMPEARLNAASGNVDGFGYNVLLFFFGGEHDREGLAVASRMVHHQGMSVSVLRFLPSRSIKDNQAERKLDNRMVEQFRHENNGNERVEYREVLVKDMEEVVAVIREATEEAAYDLLIVGARHVVNSVVSEGGLMEWSDCPELGVIGDLLASPDFGGGYTMLVVMQQDQSSGSASEAAQGVVVPGEIVAGGGGAGGSVFAAGCGGGGGVGIRRHGSSLSLPPASSSDALEDNIR